MKVYTFKCLSHSLHINYPHLFPWEEKSVGTQFSSSKISHYGEEQKMYSVLNTKYACLRL